MQTALCAVGVYQLAEAGISNVLALKSYEIATNPIDDIVIRISGVNKDSKSTIYRNHYSLLATKPEVVTDTLKGRVIYAFVKRIMVRLVKLTATSDILCTGSSTTTRVIVTLACIPLFVLPPLRVKFTCKPLDSTPNAPISYLSEVKPHQVGLRGIVSLGINKETPKRMFNNHRQVRVGLVQLGCALLLVSILFDRFVASPRITIAALMLA